MGKLVTCIQKTATGRTTLIFLTPAMAVYSLMLLYTIPQVERYAQGMKLFDLSPTGYSYEYALELLGALDLNGRSLYLYRQLPLDFIYPLLFSVSCCFVLSWLFAKSLTPNSKLFYLCFVPVAAGLFDYLENIAIINMLTTYPHVTEHQVAIASVFTVLKSGLTTAFFLSLLAGGILLLNRKVIR